MRPKMKKSIAIIGEGETEWFYFESMRTFHHYSFKMAPDFPQHSDINHLIGLAERYLKEGYDYVVCLIDMDRMKDNGSEWKKYQKYKKDQKYKEVLFIETRLCTEFWFLLHFLPRVSVKVYTTQEKLLKELQKYMPGYEKTKRYFRQTNLYCYLKQHGDLQRAIKYAEQLCQLNENHPEDEIPYSEIYQVIQLLNESEPKKS